jgi:hypothetical protein
MTKLLFRIIVLTPAITLLLGMWVILGRANPDWPEPAMQYLAWYRGSSPTAFEFWSARAGLLGLLGIMASSVGVLFFWSPARYSYVAFALLAVIAELPTTPVLVGLPDMILDNLTKIFLGICLALMFTQPCAAWFARAQKA